MANNIIVTLDESDSRVSAAIDAERRLYERYNISAKIHRVPVSEIGIHVRVCEIGEGEPLLVIPGNIGDSFPFIPLIAQLRGRRILALNRPGGGLSEGFDHHSVDFRRLANLTLRSVLDYFQIDSVSVAAHSIGGHWSLWFAIDQPKQVKKLILLGAPGNVIGCKPPFPLRLVSVPRINRLLFSALVNKPPQKALNGLYFMGHSRKTIESLPLEMRDCYYTFQRLPNYMVSSLSMMEEVNTLFGSKKNIHINAEDLSRIRQPVLLVWGQNDPFGQKAKGKEIMDALPDASLKIIENGGHLPWLDEPVKCVEWVSTFLDAEM